MKECIQLNNKQKKEHYDNLNGLRTIGALSIPFMHILANSQYEITNKSAINIIMSFAMFVQLFFIMSAFGMCCGYYEKIKSGTISLNSFYLKRYKKLFPFFALLALLDFIIGKGSDSIYELFADLTLAFGLLPNSDIQVIGVGWTLGVIFAFYMLFPFFVFSIDNKKRAWFSLMIAVTFYYACEYYFVVDGHQVRCNFLIWSSYFVTGGLIYLYRKKICEFFGDKRLSFFVVCCIASVLWYFLPKEHGIETLKTLTVFALWVMYAISVKSSFLNNRVTKFFSDISFEIYLSHMMIFRVVEKLGLINLSSNDIVSYLITVTLVICLDTVFVVIVKKVLSYIMNFFENRKVINSGIENI